MRITGSEPSVTMSARVKAPGLSTAFGLGTSASTRRVRFCSCTIGLSRTTRPWWTVASPSTVSRTVWPARTPTASRSGTGRRNRSGCVRTSVATGAPAPRYSPTAACFRLTAPSKGETSTVSTSCCRASSSSERRCVSVAWRLRTSSIASW